MIEREFAEAQVRRLSGKAGWPFDEAGQVELARVAAKYASSTVQLRDVITGLSEESERCPDPGELRRALEATAPPKARADCEQCHGTGYIHGLVIRGYEASRRCDCQTGREYAAKDLEAEEAFRKRNAWMFTESPR